MLITGVCGRVLWPKMMLSINRCSSTAGAPSQTVWRASVAPGQTYASKRTMSSVIRAGPSRPAASGGQSRSSSSNSGGSSSGSRRGGSSTSAPPPSYKTSTDPSKPKPSPYTSSQSSKPSAPTPVEQPRQRREPQPFVPRTGPTTRRGKMAAAANAKALLPVPGPNRATRRAAATAAAATDAPPSSISLPSASEDASNSPSLSSAATSTHVSAAPISHISSSQDLEDDEADEQEFDEDDEYEEEEEGSVDESDGPVTAFGLGDSESDTMDLEAFLADPQAVAALRSKMMVALASQHKRAFPEAGEAIDAALSAADPMAGWGSAEAEEEEEEGVDGEFEEGECVLCTGSF